MTKPADNVYIPGLDGLYSVDSEGHVYKDGYGWLTLNASGGIGIWFYGNRYYFSAQKLKDTFKQEILKVQPKTNTPTTKSSDDTFIIMARDNDIMGDTWSGVDEDGDMADEPFVFSSYDHAEKIAKVAAKNLAEVVIYKSFKTAVKTVSFQ